MIRDVMFVLSNLTFYVSISLSRSNEKESFFR